jgi:hypothetical protein
MVLPLSAKKGLSLRKKRTWHLRGITFMGRDLGELDWEIAEML